MQPGEAWRSDLPENDAFWQIRPVQFNVRRGLKQIEHSLRAILAQAQRRARTVSRLKFFIGERVGLRGCLDRGDVTFSNSRRR
jgi:hypothetical protein